MSKPDMAREFFRFPLKALPLRFVRFVCDHVPRRADPLVVTAAEQVLSTMVGHPTQFTQVKFISERGRRNLLLRCHCPSDTGLPPSLIIKKVKANSYNPDNPNSWDTFCLSQFVQTSLGKHAVNLSRLVTKDCCFKGSSS